MRPAAHQGHLYYHRHHTAPETKNKRRAELSLPFFLYLIKIKFLRAYHLCLLTVAFIIFTGFAGQSQKRPVKYTDYDRGYSFFWYNKWDSAYLMFNRYVNNADDTLKKGDAYKYMGEIQWRIGDSYGAQESLLTATNTLNPINKNHHEVLSIVYNLLGNVNLDLKRYDDAMRFYDSAINISRGTDYMLEVMNGKAIMLQKAKKYNDAVALYDSILALKPHKQEVIARTIDNNAKTKWLRDVGYPALPEYRTALQIRIDSQYLNDLDASYAHISDYYAKINPDSALWYAKKMFERAKENQNPDDIKEALDKLIRLSHSAVIIGQLYDQYNQLSDSIQFSRDTTRNRFALIRYDVQKSKVDNLVLKQHVTRQQILIYTLSAVAVAIILLLSVWYDKRRKRMKLDSEIAIRESKLKTSRKVHDVVANGLYVILNKLEHGKEIDREPLTTGIEELYEKSRNISYEDAPADDNADYDKKIHDLFDSFSNEKTKVFTAGSRQALWSRMTGAQKHELYLTLKEIMINMSKHSRAGNAAVAFRQEKGRGLINYTDDGVGFPDGVKFGNGLNSTVNRIKSLNGEVIFGKSERGGASVAISFPLQSNTA